MGDRDRAKNKVADSHHWHGKRAGVSLLAVEREQYEQKNSIRGSVGQQYELVNVYYHRISIQDLLGGCLIYDIISPRDNGDGRIDEFDHYNVVHGGSRKADCFYLGKTVFNFRINKSDDCLLIIVV